ELVRLLEAGGRWRDLTQALERELGTVPAADIDRQVALLMRLGEIRRGHLNKHAEAAQAYELVLERRPGHGKALEALEELYTSMGRNKDLLRVLELRVEASGSAPERASLLSRMAALRERANDVDGAL